MVTYYLPMDAVFRALADPTRREILDALFAEDGQTVTQLAERFAEESVRPAREHDESLPRDTGLAVGGDCRDHGS